MSQSQSKSQPARARAFPATPEGLRAFKRAYAFGEIAERPYSLFTAFVYWPERGDSEYDGEEIDVIAPAGAFALARSCALACLLADYEPGGKVGPIVERISGTYF